MKLLEGIEKREWWLESNVRNTCLAEVIDFEKPGYIHVIDAAYVEKLERMLAKAIEQRNSFIVQRDDKVDLLNAEIISQLDAELRAIAEGK